MADNTKLLLLAGAGFAVYWFYFRNTVSATVSGPAAPSTSGGAPAAGGITPAPGALANPPAPAPPAAAKPALATIQARIVANSGNPSAGLSVDNWEWYLDNELTAAGLPAGPDPMPLFSAVIPGFTRDQLLNFGQFWVVMAPALRAAPYGLSGLGLGWYQRTR
jgi:hypothetical protein